MPLIIDKKDVMWCETEEEIVISVQLSSRIDVKPSIFIMSKYLKLSSPPYIWECFLASSINVEDSFARIGDDTVSFELKKTIPEFWKKLADSEAGDEIYRKEKREEAFQEHQKYLENVSEMTVKKQRQIKSASVRKQMELEDNERKNIENMKREENERFIASIKRKEEQIRANKISEKRKLIIQESQNIPEARKSGLIKVSFTPRVFPTAARESQEAEEKEWLEKQLAANMSLKLDLEELSSEERNPVWLKSKAESMMKKEDFRSAINAFSLAIRMCPNLYSLYSGRATCHLKLRNFHKAIEDSSKAIELLVPQTKSNAEARVEAHKIRGTAFQMLNLPLEGLIELEAAIKIDPYNEDLKEYAKTVRDCVENDTELQKQ